jgi:hypothetical protein
MKSLVLSDDSAQRVIAKTYNDFSLKLLWKRKQVVGDDKEFFLNAEETNNLKILLLGK